jgi:hypothetical protein
MLRGVTPSAEEMVGTAVLRIVVSSDSMKKATATSQGKRRLEASVGADDDGGTLNVPYVITEQRLREEWRRTRPLMLVAANPRGEAPPIAATC